MHKVTVAQIQLFSIVFLSLSAIVWIGKKLTTQFAASLQLKTVVFFCVAITALFISLLLKDKAQQLINAFKSMHTVIQERITPLVWLFALWVFISFFLVTYQTWFTSTDNITSKEAANYDKPDEKRPNIVLVTYDALTARHMSSYGYKRETTPFITEWAKDASLFTNAEAASNWTASTTASLMQGKRVWIHRRFSRMGESRPVRNDLENMPYLLKKHGYFNMAFIVNSIASVDKLHVEDYFDVAASPSSMYRYANVVDYVISSTNQIINETFDKRIKFTNWIFRDNFILLNWLRLRALKNIEETRYPPELAYNQFFNILEKTTHRPFFVWIHMLPPHSPYLAPKPFKGMFDQSDRMNTYHTVEAGFFEAKNSIATHNKTPDSFETLVARYDEFIRYCDEKFKDFIEDVRLKNKMKNTVIIFSSDHGFNSDYKMLASSVFPSLMTDIPLIIKHPDRKEGQIINDHVEQIDIPATILDLAHIPFPKWIEGRSLLPLMLGKKLAPKPAFSMSFINNPVWNRITKGDIAIWDGDFKLIHNLENDKSILFNLKEDPDELKNLFDKETETGQRLLKVVLHNLEKADENFLMDKR
jgi:arylsulfatase A-like enzyme